MLKEILKTKFHIETEPFSPIGPYEARSDQTYLYLLIPVKEKDPAEVMERFACAGHMVSFGENRVFQFMQENKQSCIISWKNEQVCILFQKKENIRPVKRKGRTLALFHSRGRTVSFSLHKMNWLGKWRPFWIQRLEQLEKEWSRRLMDVPEDDFERMFLESYPYYMGLAENAIQYLADTEIDGKPFAIDGGTICHYRFTPDTWGSPFAACNPFDWIFDHCARDLAEWTRGIYFQKSPVYERDVWQFFLDYQSISPLSPFAWRILYARLLFPLHYFECVESYFTAQSEQKKLLLQERMKSFLSHAKDYELFLRHFFHIAGAPVQAYKIPVPEWIKG